MLTPKEDVNSWVTAQSRSSRKKSRAPMTPIDQNPVIGDGTPKTQEVKTSRKKSRVPMTPIDQNSTISDTTPKTEEVARRIDFDKENQSDFENVDLNSPVKGSMPMPPPPPPPPPLPPAPPKAIKRTEASKNIKGDFAGVLNSITAGGFNLKKAPVSISAIDKARSPSTPVRDNPFINALRTLKGKERTPPRALTPEEVLKNLVMDIIKLEDNLREFENRKEVVERRNKNNDEFNNKLTDARKRYNALLLSLAPAKLNELKSFVDRFGNNQELKKLIKEFEDNVKSLKSILEQVNPRFYVQLEEYFEKEALIQKEQIKTEIVKKKFAFDLSLKALMKSDSVEQDELDAKYDEYYGESKAKYNDKVAKREKGAAKSAQERCFEQVKSHEEGCEVLLSRAENLIASLTKKDEEIKKNAGVAGDVEIPKLLDQQNEKINELNNTVENLKAELAKNWFRVQALSECMLILTTSCLFYTKNYLLDSTTIENTLGKVYLGACYFEAASILGMQVYEGKKCYGALYSKPSKDFGIAASSLASIALSSLGMVNALVGARTEFVIGSSLCAVILGAISSSRAHEENAKNGVER